MLVLSTTYFLGVSMAGRQDQLKQVWFTEDDTTAFERVAEKLEADGVDVQSDYKNAKSKYSHTKVLRHLLHEADNGKRPD